MIKNIFKRREERDTYLTNVSRHRWSRQIMMKLDTVVFVVYLYSWWKPQCFIVICLLERCLQTFYLCRFSFYINIFLVITFITSFIQLGLGWYWPLLPNGFHIITVCEFHPLHLPLSWCLYMSSSCSFHEKWAHLVHSGLILAIHQCFHGSFWISSALWYEF